MNTPLPTESRIQPAIINYLTEGTTDLMPTDVGNANRLIRQHGHRIRYSYGHASWMIYDGGRWKKDDRNEIIELAKETARTIYDEAARCDIQGQRRVLSALALSTETQGKLNAMVNLAKSDKAIGVSGSDLDADPNLLNVANGTLDLLTGKLRPHSPNDLLTRMTGVVFDPDAKCPTWDRFIEEITGGDESLQTYLAQVVGYCLTGRTDEQAFFILNGSGANGKSVLLNVVQRLLGEYGSTTDFNTFTDHKGDGPRADLAKLVGARLAVCSETGPGDRLNERVVKQLTGGDEISVRFLYGNFFEYRPQFKIFVATNHLPTIVGTGHGIWRRDHVIPFNVTFTEERQDKDLTNKLLAELSGILNWAVAGCLSWQASGRLLIPKCVDEARQAHREEMDSVYAFINQECILGPAFSTQSDELWNAYGMWSERNGVVPVSQTLLGRRLKDDYKIGKRKDGAGRVVRLGIRLKTSAEKEELSAVAAPVAVPTTPPAPKVKEYDPFDGLY